MQLKRIVSERIKIARHLADLTQQELASKLQINRSQVSRWENGQCGDLGINLLEAYAKITGVSLCYLVGFCDNPYCTSHKNETA